MSMKEKIKQSFSDASNSYDEVTELQKHNALLLVEQILDFIQNKINPKTILDIGTGTGYVPEILLKYYPEAHYILNDISSGMINKVKSKFAAQKNFDFYLGDIDVIDIPECDIIISNFVLHWSEDLDSVIAKCYAKSCVLGFTCLVDDTFSEWNNILKEYGVSEFVKQYPKKEELESILKKLTKNVDYKVERFTIEFPNIQSLFKYIKKLGAAISEIEIPFNVLKRISNDYKDKEISLSYKVFFCVTEGGNY